jgi:hypothetical protein
MQAALQARAAFEAYRAAGATVLPNIDPPPHLAHADWAWVTKDEVSDFLGPDMQALVAKAF